MLLLAGLLLTQKRSDIPEFFDDFPVFYHKIRKCVFIPKKVFYDNINLFLYILSPRMVKDIKICTKNNNKIDDTLNFLHQIWN